jgi:hypothetical protein
MVPHPRVYSRGLESGLDMDSGPRLDSVGADMDIGSSTISTGGTCRSTSSTRAACASRAYDAAASTPTPRRALTRLPLASRPVARYLHRGGDPAHTPHPLGPCVYCLPLYDPLRLIEEVCMLDQLSRGRFDFGVGRGIVSLRRWRTSTSTTSRRRRSTRKGLEVILQGCGTRCSSIGPALYVPQGPHDPAPLPETAPGHSGMG